MSPDPHKRIVMLGPPGAGKGTQAKLLSQDLGLKHIASGDLFRHHLSQATPLGLQAQEYMDRGYLVPDEITITMVLEEALGPCNNGGFIMDGFPRNLRQAENLDEALNEQDLEIDEVLLVVVPKEELVRRLTGRWLCSQCQASYHLAAAPPKVEGVCDVCEGQLYQRDDDRPEAVNTRLEVYYSQTEPLAKYYLCREKLREIKGVGSVEEVRQRLLEALRRRGLGPRHVG